MPEQSQIDAEARGGDIEQRLAALEAWQDKMRRNGLSAMEIRPGLMRYGANVQQLDNNGQQILSGSGGTTMVYFVPELSSDPNNEDIKSRIQGVNSATLAELVADSSITSLGLQGKVFTYASNQANDVAGIRLDPLTPDIVQNTNIDVYAQRSNTFGNMVLTNIVFRLGSFTSDPGSLADGDMWYRSDTDKLYFRANGATVELGGGSSMPMPPLVGTDSWHCLGTQLAAAGAATPASATYPAANRAIYIPLVVTKDITVVKLWCVNGGVTSGNIDMGIYNSAFARQVSIGSTAQAGAGAIQEFDIADTALSAGLYYIGIAMDNTTGTLYRYTSAIGGFHFQAYGLAQEASAFALPATATPADFATAYIPLCGIATRTQVA